MGARVGRRVSWTQESTSFKSLLISGILNTNCKFTKLVDSEELSLSAV